MSWVYSVESEADCLEATSLDGAALEQLKSSIIADESCCNGSATGSSSHSQYGMMCEPSPSRTRIAAPTSNGSYQSEKNSSSVRAFHVPTSPAPGPIITSMEKSEASMEARVAFGGTQPESFVKYDPQKSLWRTLQTLFPEDLDWSLVTFPKWGMMRDGECFPLVVSEQTISESECSSLLPTPTNHNAKEGAYPAEFTRNTPTLAAQIGGKINPEWNEWRMGFPINFSALQALEMPKFQQWCALHTKHFLNDPQ